MKDKLEEILSTLKQEQSAHRFEHTIGVMYTAAALCMKYEVDMQQGMLAAALHDCGKPDGIKDYISECEKYNLPINEDARNAPHLLHADLGAYLARERFFIEDPEILHAIKVHTTGCPNMSLLDQIIFVADYIEPGREHAPNLETIRKLAFEDMDRCTLFISEQILDYLKQKNYYIGKSTIETCEYYKNKVML